MSYSSKLIEKAVEEFSKLPSIGKKSAFRLVLHLIQKDKESVESFLGAIRNMKENLKECNTCFNLSDDLECAICSNIGRDKTVLCVVESVRDVIAIEETQQYNGSYHVLGGVISPLEGIGVDDIRIAELTKRVREANAKELIMALSPTIEGDTTVFYISKKLADSGVKISTLSRGVAFGSELEYTDEFTLGRSILSRVPYTQSSLK
jgi:recombination protein RecR